MTLTDEELAEHVERVIELLRPDGERVVRETPPGSDVAAFDVRIKAPGGAAGHDASFRYFERFRRVSNTWTLDGYVYLMSSRVGRGQLEYHLHPLGGSVTPVLHAHCAGGPSESPSHVRSHQVLLEEARDEFVRLYAAEATVDCQSRYPLTFPKA